jgi:hypothetical protein
VSLTHDILSLSGANATVNVKCSALLACATAQWHTIPPGACIEPRRPHGDYPATKTDASHLLREEALRLWAPPS